MERHTVEVFWSRCARSAPPMQQGHQSISRTGFISLRHGISVLVPSLTLRRRCAVASNEARLSIQFSMILSSGLQLIVLFFFSPSSVPQISRGRSGRERERRAWKRGKKLILIHENIFRSIVYILSVREGWYGCRSLCARGEWANFSFFFFENHFSAVVVVLCSFSTQQK